MTNLPPIPKNRNWSPETWRAGLDEAVRLCGWTDAKTWAYYTSTFANELSATKSIIAHATTLIETGIVKSVVGEADVLLMWASSHSNVTPLDGTDRNSPTFGMLRAALDKARAGE